MRSWWGRSFVLSFLLLVMLGAAVVVAAVTAETVKETSQQPKSIALHDGPFATVRAPPAGTTRTGSFQHALEAADVGMERAVLAPVVQYEVDLGEATEHGLSRLHYTVLVAGQKVAERRVGLEHGAFRIAMSHPAQDPVLVDLRQAVSIVVRYSVVMVEPAAGVGPDVTLRLIGLDTWPPQEEERPSPLREAVVDSAIFVAPGLGALVTVLGFTAAVSVLRRRARS